MKKVLNNISSEEILKEAAELLQAAFITTNMAQKYSLFHEANDLKKIAALIYKYELMRQKGDY